jgi:trimeric autotransporter adhesin
MCKHLVHRLGACVLLFCLGTLDLTAAEHHGQVKFGGLPVPGATITAVQGDKKLVTVTDAQGLYAFPELQDGIWILKVEMLCFSPAVREVEVSAAASGVEWELKLLPLNEINAVTGPPATSVPRPAMPITAAGASARAGEAKKDIAPGKGNSTVKADQAAQAAANSQGRFQRTDLNAVNPGNTAVPANNADSGAFGGQTSDELAQRAADGLLVNGSVNNSATSAFGLFPAFGNVRKGLGSLYNGSLGLILDNSALNARSYSFTGQDTPKPAYNRFTGLAAFGGPLKLPYVKKNGPNIVLNYQWTRNRNATTQPGLMPTLAERGGDFSQVLNAFGQPVRIFDPVTGLQFPDNVIPRDRISRQAKALLELYPQPKFMASGRYNYQIPILSVMHQDSLQLRVSKALNRNNQLSGSFAYQGTRSDNPNLFSFLDKTDTTGLNSSINWRHNFTPRLLLNLGYQYSRSAVQTHPYFENLRNVSGEAGISGNNQEPMNWGPPDLGFSGGITALSDGRAASHRNQTSALSYAMLWSHGRHYLTFGADYRRQQFNDVSQQNPRGTYTFTGAATQAYVNGLPVAGTGSDFANFLLGIPDTLSIAFGNADKYFRASSYDAYLTDDFRISPGLTLNAGLRWEYGSPITELYDRLVNLDIAPGYAAVAPVVANHPIGPLTGETYPDSLLHPDKGAFQPRIGFAWRPFPASSLVIRAGYGIYYNTSVYTTLATQMAQQAPLSKSLSVQNSSQDPLTLANGFNTAPGNTPAAFAVDPHFQVGYAQNWQLSIQRDLPGALVMTAIYLGTKGTRGTQQFLPNTYPMGAANPCPACPTGFAYLTSNGNSTRESGQVQLRRRLQNGITASLQYTYSKALDDAALGGWGPGTSVIAQNWLNPGAEKGLSSFDQRHLVNLQMQYSSGMGVRGGVLMGGWKGRLLKEWTFTGQITAGSGFPLTPIYFAAVKGTGVTGSIRPDATGASPYDAPAGYFLNPAAYTAPAQGNWGNAGRNTIIGPAQFSVNASMGRTFRIKDRVMLDLRIDSANVINHVTFQSWNATVTSSQFGLPTSANPMRNLQITLRARI